MTLEQPGLDSNLPNGSGRERGATFYLVSELRFRRFYKMILKFFVNDFDIVYNMHCICI